MNTSALKKELHHAIDVVADNSLLETVYTLLQKSMYMYELSTAQKKELQHRLAAIDAESVLSVPYKTSINSIRKRIKTK
jgi:CRISPR/Cas system-associated endoribonuclease Cas2